MGLPGSLFPLQDREATIPACPLTGPIDPEQSRTHARLLPPEVLALTDEPFIRSCALYDEFVRRLAQRVFREAGLEEAATHAGTAAEMVQRAGLSPEHALVPTLWLLRYLSERKDLERVGIEAGEPVPPNPAASRGAGARPDDGEPAGAGEERFRLHRPLRPADPSEPAEEQKRVAPSWLPAYRVAEVAAGDYPAFLRGEKTGEEILFSTDRLELWSGYFSNDNGLYSVNNRIGAIAAESWLRPPLRPGRAEPQEARPAGETRDGAIPPAARAREGLTILELGGGLGSAALALLERFEGCGELGAISAYRFTELVPAFLRKGQRAVRSRHPEAGFLSFARLDMDEPFERQGVAPGSVSMVYAVNTVHAARDLRFTLGEIRRSLKPGGLLVLPECILPRPRQATYVEFVFNLTAPFRRPGGGFLTPEGWEAALEGAGFVDVRFFPDLRTIREEIPAFYASAVGASVRVGSSQNG